MSGPPDWYGEALFLVLSLIAVSLAAAGVVAHGV